MPSIHQILLALTVTLSLAIAQTTTSSSRSSTRTSSSSRTSSTRTSSSSSRTSSTRSSSTKTSTTSTVKWQASGGVSCPHPSVTTVWPSYGSTISLPTASIIASGAVFNGNMNVYDRAGSAGDCAGQSELDEDAAVFILEDGATIRNVVIGKAQAEGIHCRGNCRIENVWWDDVCEDAATFKGADPNINRYVIGGGAREASDKIFQFNGAGTLYIDGFFAKNFGKFVRSCGNCSAMYQRHIVLNNIVGIKGVIIGVNRNYGDTATLSNYCLAQIGVICVIYDGCQKTATTNCNAEEVSEGALPPYCVVNGDDWT